MIDREPIAYRRKFMTKQQGIIATIVSAVVVGCPSCFCMMLGLGSALGAGTFTLGDQSAPIDPVVGVLMLCLGFLGLLIPLVVWFLMVRGKTA
jgi:hypothetical protein